MKQCLFFLLGVTKLKNPYVLPVVHNLCQIIINDVSYLLSSVVFRITYMRHIVDGRCFKHGMNVISCTIGNSRRGHINLQFMSLKNTVFPSYKFTK